ncbi:MAG: exodeoxyribonuclease VII large subunit [Candidatus Acetothermia bacterium]|jgi:exodeoxyribonuclease VII large subunit|nr:exodeoxyribonuclease VII large subunit [Candidatus Acetothermia bacterium]
MNDQVYTPSGLNRLVRQVLEGQFPAVWVRGEVSRPKLGPTGHLYFTLKDAQAAVEVVQFRGLRPLAYIPADGEEVLVFGTLTLYEPQGKYELRARTVHPAGIGLLRRELEALKARLEAEGLFALERKRPLPPYPRRIGVITSRRGAAIRDIVTVAARRWPPAELYVFPVRVQGEGAEWEVAQAIADAALFHRETPLDVLIVGRGGGAAEDLAAFNTEAVARAIFASPVPVVSAVGHEVDWTIADLVADLRAPTPSAAAELAVPSAAELLGRVRDRLRRARGAVLAPVDRTEAALRRVLARRVFRDPVHTLLAPMDRLDQALRRRPFRAPFALVEGREERLDHIAERLPLALRPQLLAAQARAERLIARLEGASPLGILSRGYSLTLGPDGRPLRRAGEVEQGDLVETVLGQGRLRSRVEEVEAGDPRGEAGPA